MAFFINKRKDAYARGEVQHQAAENDNANDTFDHIQIYPTCD